MWCDMMWCGTCTCCSYVYAGMWFVSLTDTSKILKVNTANLVSKQPLGVFVTLVFNFSRLCTFKVTVKRHIQSHDFFWVKRSTWAGYHFKRDLVKWLRYLIGSLKGGRGFEIMSLWRIWSYRGLREDCWPPSAPPSPALLDQEVENEREMKPPYH